MISGYRIAFLQTKVMLWNVNLLIVDLISLYVTVYISIYIFYIFVNHCREIQFGIIAIAYVSLALTGG